MPWKGLDISLTFLCNLHVSHSIHATSLPQTARSGRSGRSDKEKNTKALRAPGVGGVQKSVRHCCSKWPPIDPDRSSVFFFLFFFIWRLCPPLPMWVPIDTHSVVYHTQEFWSQTDPRGRTHDMRMHFFKIIFLFLLFLLFLFFIIFLCVWFGQQYALLLALCTVRCLWRGRWNLSWPELTWKQTLNRGDLRRLCFVLSFNLQSHRSHINKTEEPMEMENWWGKAKGQETVKERSGLYIPEDKETNLCAGVVTGNDFLLWSWSLLLSYFWAADVQRTLHELFLCRSEQLLVLDYSYSAYAAYASQARIWQEGIGMAGVKTCQNALRLRFWRFLAAAAYFSPHSKIIAGSGSKAGQKRVKSE